MKASTRTLQGGREHRQCPRHWVAQEARVPLQVSGIRVFVAVPRMAVTHAIQRDAWPVLATCVTPLPPGVRGWITVSLVQGDGGRAVRLQGPALARIAPLRECVERAAARIVLPPFEGEPPDVLASFDLAFDMPPLSVRHVADHLPGYLVPGGGGGRTAAPRGRTWFFCRKAASRVRSARTDGTIAASSKRSRSS